MPTLRVNKGELVKTLGEGEIQQRVIQIDKRASFLPPPGELFDVWHAGQPWASKVRAEHCECRGPDKPHEHRYIEGAELHVGVRWVRGARLRFWVDADGRIQVEGDVEG